MRPQFQMTTANLRFKAAISCAEPSRSDNSETLGGVQITSERVFTGVEPFTMALPKPIMLRIQAAGQNSPDVESAGIFRANHLADAPWVVALVVFYRMATRNTAPG